MNDQRTVSLAGGRGASHPLRFRLGVDIGGTFTDVTLLDEVSGDIRFSKVLTTPSDPSEGFLAGVERIFKDTDVPRSSVRFVVHATTVGANAIIEGKIARTGFITTDGFSDMLEIGRQARRADGLYDIFFEKPRPLVPRHLCYGIPERLDERGGVVTPFDAAAAARVAEPLREEKIESIAVCFLHSYINPEHEQHMGKILRERYPDALVSLSSDVAPEYREYFRASTTVVNACIRPAISRYLQNIEDRLGRVGLCASLLIMQSNGGVYTSASAAERPVFMVESGPAAGVIAAAYLGGALGHRHMISFDMGGTTAKAALILDGVPRVTKEYEVGSTARANTSGQTGTGYPIRTPVIDLVEIGAGGGSIAWIDSGGALRVGPHSAGADPGPACYGRGGDEPTITDANLVLGRLNPRFFLGGELELDVARARATIQEKCAGALRLDVVETAAAIVEVCNNAMINALRLVSIQRGYDPRDLVLVAFGGAGPLHANRLAEETEIGSILVPMSPGTASAMGLLVTDLKRDYSQSLVQPADRVDPTELESAFRRLEERGRADLLRDGTDPEDIAFIRQAEMRYVGQSFELTIPLPEHVVDPRAIAAALEEFHQAHDRAYGYTATDEPVEFVNLRLGALGRIAKPRMREVGKKHGDATAAQKATRQVYFMESGGFVACPIYDRYHLFADAILLGPAVVEEFDSTTVIHPGYRAVVDRFGNLLISKSSSEDRMADAAHPSRNEHVTLRERHRP
jgi:N-methylhydantoinase A